jgi:hypothetical protein
MQNAPPLEGGAYLYSSGGLYSMASEAFHVESRVVLHHLSLLSRWVRCDLPTLQRQQFSQLYPKFHSNTI